MISEPISQPTPFEPDGMPTPNPSEAFSSSRNRPWRWAGLALAAGSAIALAATLLQRPEPEPVEAAPLPVETTQLDPVESYVAERAYTGEIRAGRSSTLGFEGGGTVVELLVDEGDRVQLGQSLARLDTRSLQAQRQQFLAQRAQAQAQLAELQAGPRQEDIMAAQAAVADLEQQVALARIQRQRREDLYARGAISQEELDQQSFGAGSLESRLQQAQAQLEELQRGTRPEQINAQIARVQQIDASLQALAVDLSKSVITAPFSGQVNQRFVDEGTVIGPGQTVFELIETDTLEARIGIPSELAEGLSVGSAQTVKVGNRTLSATVNALLPQLEATSRTVTVVLALQDAADIPVGQTARLVVNETQTAAGFWLPTAALIPADQGLWAVYVAQPAGDSFTVARRDVEVLHTNGDRSLVRGTIQPGEQAITAGTHRIAPGQTVTLIANEFSGAD